MGNFTVLKKNPSPFSVKLQVNVVASLFNEFLLFPDTVADYRHPFVIAFILYIQDVLRKCAYTL